MLRLQMCVDWRANREALLQQVCRAASQGQTGQVVIVPEQMSFEMERELCRAGGDTICRYAEVLSFSRLANRVFTEYGGLRGVTLDKGGRLTAMAAAIEQVRAQLKQYGNCGEKPEFLLQLLETLDECKTFCVTPEVLRSAASRTQGALAVKLEELSLLAQSYDAVCANGAQDGSSRLAKLLQMLQEVPWAEGRHFYLEGFTDFNGLELAILTSLMESGAPVTAALLCDRPEGGLPVFDGARNTAKALCRAAERCGQTAQVVLCTPWKGSPALEYLRGHLFAAQTAACDAAAPELELYTAPDLFAEAEHLAGALLREAQNGQRWRSMTVVCGDMTRWRPVLQDVFARCSIPAYYSGSEPISEKPAIRAVLSGLAAAAGGMETEDVLAYLKSGFSGLSREGCDRLENYAFMWSVRGGGWKREWKMHPDGFGKKADARSTQRLQQLNADREAATAPLWRLRNALSAAKDTGEQVEALCDFLEEIGFAGRLQQLTEQFTAQGKLQQAQEAAQLYEILIGALEQLYAVLGKTVRSADAFVRLIQVLLSQYTVGTIPAAMDCVRVGALLDMRRSRTTRLFVVGAADGCFPACVQQTGLLSEHERERLRALGVPVAPGAPEKLEREMLAIYDVLSAPEAGLSVSCTAGQESYLFRRLQKLFPDAVRGEPALPPLVERSAAAAEDYAAQLWRTDAADAGMLMRCLPGEGAALRAVLERADFVPGALQPETVTGLYGDKIFLSASRIDQQAQCRCACFLNYGLKAAERKKAAFDAPAYGTFVHYVLERTARGICAEGGFRRVTEERAVQLATDAIADYNRQELPELSEQPERFAYLYERNLREILDVVKDLWEEMQHSSFAAEGFEVRFARDGAMQTIPVAGKYAQSEVSGAVDRVDLLRGADSAYVRVVDYKTGKKEFDYTDLRNGVGLQMLIYLFALEERGEALFHTRLKPGGVLYFPARLDLLRVEGRPSVEKVELARQKERRRKGLLLDEEPVLLAMEDQQDPAYLPYFVTKDGTRRGALASAAQFGQLRDFVARTLSSMTDDIASGNVTPEPYFRGREHNACRFCPYGAICHTAAGAVTKRVRARMTQDEFWRQIEEEENG